MDKNKLSSLANDVLELMKSGAKDGSLTSLDLLNIERAAKHYARQVEVKRLRESAVSIGSMVKFTSSATGEVMTGRLVKVNQKRAIVDCGSSREFTVPLSMLSAVL